MRFSTTSVVALTAALAAGSACGAENQGEQPVSSAVASTFDWGGDCDDGSGRFVQTVLEGGDVIVGAIPPGKENVRIDLSAETDVDVRLVEAGTNEEIISWPDGRLNGPTEECTEFKGVSYCYSGYNGTGGNAGYEWIEVRGITNTDLEMRAFGYEAGDATVTYAFEAPDTCNEIGDGSFTQKLAKDAVQTIGEIPAGKVNVRVELTSVNDLDIQLFDGDVALVQWPNGKLTGPGKQTLEYAGMTIVWSGYNGEGGAGNEYIRVTGTVTRALTMKAFAFAAGTADVAYEWGVGVGAACGSRGLDPCVAGLECKEGDDGDTARDIPGECHTQTWCESASSASSDCADLLHPAIPGYWGCEKFECTWKPGPVEPEPTYCAGDAMCGDDEVCNAAELCLPPPNCEPGEPCPTVCYGYCVPKPVTPTLCLTDSACESGESCNKTFCYKPPYCNDPDVVCPAVCYGACE